MSLAEYRTSDAVDVSLVDPLAERLLGLLVHFGGRVLIVSGRRSWGEQQVLWLRYLAGGPLAARPGTSNHERGAAADLRIVGDVTWSQVHTEAAKRGLRFPVPGENWHCEAAADWVGPEPKGIQDMTKEEFAAAIGAQIDPRNGLVSVPLINNEFNGFDLYPLASAVTWIHEEMKRTRHAK